MYIKTIDIFTKQESKLLGFEESPIQIRNHGDYRFKGFYLITDVKWELVEDRGAQILIPIKK